MAQVPFTSAGVASKIQELYALSDAALLLQANLIRSSFRTWINNNFILDSAQQAYLAGMDNIFIGYISQQLGMGVQHRLPVTLTAPATASAAAAPAAASDLRISKLMTCRVKSFGVEYNPAVGVIATGSVEFEVTYR